MGRHYIGLIGSFRTFIICLTDIRVRNFSVSLAFEKMQRRPYIPVYSKRSLSGM